MIVAKIGFLLYVLSAAFLIWLLVYVLIPETRPENYIFYCNLFFAVSIGIQALALVFTGYGGADGITIVKCVAFVNILLFAVGLTLLIRALKNGNDMLLMSIYMMIVGFMFGVVSLSMLYRGEGLSPEIYKISSSSSKK